MSKTLVSDLLRIFKSSVFAVLPGNLVRNSLKYCEVTEQLTIAGKKFYLEKKNVYLVGAGKAVQNMALEVGNILGSKIKTGIISIPLGSIIESPLNNIIFYEGAKSNLPDDNAVSTSKEIEQLALSLKIDDFLIVLLSGGGSALLSLPKSPITLEEKTNLIKKLANAGADIKELNTVRKRLSDIKGGQLAAKAYPAQVVSLILSDIVGDPLHLIASGPTTQDEDAPSEAMNIIKKYQLQNHLPNSITKILSKNSESENFPQENVHNFLIGSNKIGTEAAFNESKLLKYESTILSNSVTGNVKDVAQKYIKLTMKFCEFMQGRIKSDDLKYGLKSIEIPGLNFNVVDNLDASNIAHKNMCLILGGEITVEVKGSGVGGRNQQLALEFSNLMHDTKEDMNNFNVYFLSAGTDGIDGPTDAAGAIGYHNLKSDAESDGLNVNHYLDNNDSYNFYKNFKSGELHVITNHTNTNVMDIHLIIIQRINK